LSRVVRRGIRPYDYLDHRIVRVSIIREGDVAWRFDEICRPHTMDSYTTEENQEKYDPFHVTTPSEEKTKKQHSMLFSDTSFEFRLADSLLLVVKE
jgi:hypothetical protein